MLRARGLRRPLLCLAVIAVTFASAGLAGCAEKTAPEDGARLQRTITLVYSPGTFHEVNLDMAAGASLDYNWNVSRAQQSLRFDIHAHDASGVRYAEQGAWREKSGSYVQPAAGTVSLFWENGGPMAVDLQYLIVGDFTVRSIHEPVTDAH